MRTSNFMSEYESVKCMRLRMHASFGRIFMHYACFARTLCIRILILLLIIRHISHKICWLDKASAVCNASFELPV